MKVLLIEDSPHDVELLKKYLEGHDFDHAPDYKSGLEMLQKRKYDIVFFDFSLPDCFDITFKFLPEIKQYCDKIVIMSGSDPVTFWNLVGDHVGIDGFFTKDAPEDIQRFL